MMKYLRVLVMVCGSWGQSRFSETESRYSPLARIEPDLLQRIAALNPSDKLPIDIVLKAQANALDLDASIPNLPKPERRARVGRVLMDFAQETQSDLLACLKAKEVEGKVETINPLWIVNSVACWATKDVIYEVAARADVELVCYDRVPCDLEEPEKTLRPLRLSGENGKDGIEPNMVLTNVRGAWNQGYHGEGIVLGIVDTGVWYTHLDLRNHLWTSSVYPHCGFNFARPHGPPPPPPDSLDPFDYYGHGTHVAGVATADGAYGKGTNDTMGIAPATKVMAVAVDVYLHQPYPDTVMENSMMDGIQFCIRPPRDTLNGADVITMSLALISAWLPRYAVWRVAEENVLAAGLVNTVLAGNEASARTIRCPGCCPPPWPNPANGIGGPSAAITVGATDNNDNRASFSSQGPSDMWDTIPPWNDYAYPPGLTDPDVVMPGANILSTYVGADTITGNTSYTTMSGTSMSTPAVAGVICLMLSKKPDLTPREIDSILELYAVRDLGAPGKDNSYGAGRINCSLAVAFPINIVATPEHSRLPSASPLQLSARPNPFRDHVGLRLTANSQQPLAVTIYDALGHSVRVLRMAGSGERMASWDGTDDQGRKLPAGIYLVRLNGTAQSLKTVLLMR